MTLRGKDYCNCDHAQHLRLALKQAQFELRFPSGRINAASVIRKALDIDNAARIDLWGNIDNKESRKNK